MGTGLQDGFGYGVPIYARTDGIPVERSTVHIHCYVATMPERSRA